RRLAVGAAVGGARQHAVLGGHPALAAAFKEGRRLFFQCRGAEHMGVAEFDEAGAFGIAIDIDRQLDGAQLIGGTTGRACGHFSKILECERGLKVTAGRTLHAAGGASNLAAGHHCPCMHLAAHTVRTRPAPRPKRAEPTVMMTIRIATGGQPPNESCTRPTANGPASAPRK